MIENSFDTKMHKILHNSNNTIPRKTQFFMKYRIFKPKKLLIFAITIL